MIKKLLESTQHEPISNKSTLDFFSSFQDSGDILPVHESLATAIFLQEMDDRFAANARPFGPDQLDQLRQLNLPGTHRGGKSASKRQTIAGQKGADYMAQAEIEKEQDLARKVGTRKGNLGHSGFLWDDEGNEVSNEDLILAITQRPDKLVKQNSKLQKSGKNPDGEYEEYFYNINIPAFRGMVVDEDTNQLVVLTTCPKAKDCLDHCYAVKGSYQQYKDVVLSSMRILNFLVNDPEGFADQVILELQMAKLKARRNQAGVVMRWHDAGDFFSRAYVDVAYKVANALPDVHHYCYTKSMHLFKPLRPNMEVPEMPDNFTANFSYGGGWDSKIDAAPGTGDKFSDVIMADDPITGEAVWSDLVGAKGQKDVVKNQILPEHMETLKQRISQGLGPAEDSKWREHPAFPPDAENILSFDEWKAMRADPEYDESEHQRQWIIIVDSSHGDDAARHNDVSGILLLVH